MAGFRNIVVCSDFSENSNKAFDVAAGLAQGGKLTVLHVVTASHDYDSKGTQDKMAAASTVTEVYRGKAEARMRELYGSKGEVDMAIEYGNEAEKIMAVAKDKGADLIVMGSRGIGFIQGILGGGSVVDKVVKNSTIPVLVVPA